MERVDEPRVNYLQASIDGIIKGFLSLWGLLQIILVWSLLNRCDPYTLLKLDPLFPREIPLEFGCVFFVLPGFLRNGKVRNNAALMKEYAYWLTGFLVFEIIVMVATNCFVCFADSNLTKAMDNIFADYGQKQMVTDSLDALQHDFFCCGVHNYTDWEQYPYGKQWPQSVADGCCKQENFTVGGGIGLLADPEAVSKIYTTGCLDGLKEFVIGESLTVGSDLLVYVLFPLMVMLATPILCKMIK